MRKYFTGICAILIAGLCVAFASKKTSPPGNCIQGKSYIWFLVDYGYYVECTNTTPQVSPSVLALWGHETLFGEFSWNPRTDLEAAGWLLTKEQLDDMELGCNFPPYQVVCAVAYDPAHVTSSTFNKVNINGVWYWRPKEPWGLGPQVACYLCKPNE